MPKLEELKKFEDAAEVAGCSKYTLIEYARRGILPSYKFGGSNRVLLSDLEKLVTERVVKPREK